MIQYECLEAGCGQTIRAADEAQLVAAVQRHVAEAHDSFELDEIILASAVEVEVDPAGQSDPW